MTDLNVRDVIIVGSGPAGLSAAIYATRAGLRPLVISSSAAGGQIATTDLVDNYPGIEDITGAELGQRLWDHAEHLGAEFEFDQVVSIDRREGGSLFQVVCEGGSLRARSVIYAAGASPRRLALRARIALVAGASRTAPPAMACSIVARKSLWWAVVTRPARRRSTLRRSPPR